MDVQNQHLSNEMFSDFNYDDQVVIVVVPFPAHSHLNQLLQLSCLISAYKIPVHYVSSATHVRQAKHRFDQSKFPQFSAIHFHEIPTSPFLSPPRNTESTLRFPTHLQPSFEAAMHLREPVASLLQQISTTARRIIVVHDISIACVVQDVSTIKNSDSYAFIPVSAFASFFDQWQMMGKPFPVEDEPEGLPSIQGCYSFEIINLLALQAEFLSHRSGLIYNSCRLIEGALLELVEKAEVAEGRKLWAIGPLNSGVVHENRELEARNTCLEWLDEQAPDTVLFVSFGTSTVMKDEQIKELTLGLEESKQKFMWVLREADKGDIFAGDDKRIQLPEGYEERVKEFGMIVRDWAPQLEILSHPSTGGFMSHCGWNSCLESITMGVPIVAWPMHSDQPKNALFIADILKVGLTVRKWTHEEEIITSSTIAAAVKRLMRSKEGEEMRKKAADLGGMLQQSVKEAGVSRLELDSFIAHVTR